MNNEIKGYECSVSALCDYYEKTFGECYVGGCNINPKGCTKNKIWTRISKLFITTHETVQKEIDKIPEADKSIRLSELGRRCLE